MPIQPRKERPQKPVRPRKGSSNTGFYNSTKWKQLRFSYRYHHPYCEQCLKEKNDYVPMYVVDHVIPISIGGSPDDTANFQSLCQPCHDSKSGRERHGKYEEWILNERGDKIPKGAGYF